MNIPELRLKIKQSAGVIQSREVYTVLLILFVGFSSFGLGRLSKLQEARVPISIHSASALSATPPFQGGVGGGSSSVKGEKLTVNNALEAPVALEQGGQLVASKNGTKYHYPWCSGAQRISEQNKVSFNSIEEARKAGYTPASNCKGLK